MWNRCGSFYVRVDIKKMLNIKGTHTVYFSSSLYMINQNLMKPRIHFHCITTWVAPSSG